MEKTGSTMRLYDIDNLLRGAMDDADAYAEEHDGIVPDDLAEIIAGLELDREVKIHHVALYVLEIEAAAQANKDAEERIRHRRKYLEGKADRLREYLSRIIVPGEKHSWPDVVQSWRKSQSVDVLNPSIIPSDLREIFTEIRPKKMDIKNLMKNGVAVPGCELRDSMHLQLK